MKINCIHCEGQIEILEDTSHLVCDSCGYIQMNTKFSGSGTSLSSPILKPAITGSGNVAGTNGKSNGAAQNGNSRKQEGGELRMNNAGIKRLCELTDLYSDPELDSIRVLDLSHNLITDLTGLERFGHVQKINLSDNRITEFKPVHLPELREIDLSYNQITSIQPVIATECIQRINLDHNQINELIIDTEQINVLKKQMITSLYISVPLIITLKGNPVSEKQFFHDFYEQMSLISPEDIMEEREIAGITNILKNLMKTAGNNFEKNQQIIAARNFFKRMNSLNRQDRNINYIVMITDIDISEFGYRKEQDNYYYSVKFPGVDVCVNAIRLNAGCDEVCFTRIRKLAAMKDIKEKDQIRKRLIYLLMLVIYGGSVAFVKTITGNYPDAIMLVTLIEGFIFLPLFLRIRNA